MSSTDAREQSGEPVTGEQPAPGGAEQPPGQALPARRGGDAADVPGASVSAVTGYRRRRGWVQVLVVVVVVAAALGGADAAGVFSSTKPTSSRNGQHHTHTHVL